MHMGQDNTFQVQAQQAQATGVTVDTGRRAAFDT